MRLYSSHFAVALPGAPAPERQPEMVRDGFSGWGLIFGWLVFLRPGSWLVAMLAGTASLLIGLAGARIPGTWALLPGLHLAIALFAADWRRWELGLAGLAAGPIVAAPDPDAALLRLLDLRPDLLVPTRPAADGMGVPGALGAA